MFTLDDPSQVLSFVQAPLSALRDALDDGISYADGVLEGQPFDSHYWSHSVRYRAATVLRTASEAGWSFDRTLRNSGIELRQNPILLRLLKSQEGGPPHPGGSRSRRGYYRQQSWLPMMWGDVNVGQGANLIVDWTVGPQREVLLALSKPMGVWDYQGPPKIEWRMPVVFDPASGPRFESVDEELEVEPRYDLEDEDLDSDRSA